MQVALVLLNFSAERARGRDLAAIAEACLARGHRVRLYTLEHGTPALNDVIASTEFTATEFTATEFTATEFTATEFTATEFTATDASDVEIVVVPVRGLPGYRRRARFARWIAAHLDSHPVDLVVGFDKMAGLDVYFATGACYEDKARTQRGWYYRLLPRYRRLAEIERAVFGDAQSTKILTSSAAHVPAYRQHYRTPLHRFFELPATPDRAVAAVTLLERFAVGEVRPNVAFCTLDYERASGVGRTIAELTRRCVRAGLHAQVYSLSFNGDLPEGVEAVTVPVASMTDYKLFERYVAWVERALQRVKTHCVVGFDPVPGLDFLYARRASVVDQADALRARLYKSGPAYRTLAQTETAAVGRGAKGIVVSPSGAIGESYRRVHSLPASRCLNVTPVVEAPMTSAVRARDDLGIPEDARVIAMIGTDLVAHGIDRVLWSLAALPGLRKADTHLLAAGRGFERSRSMVQTLGLAARVHERGMDGAIDALLSGVDLLVVPAFQGVFGTALLEAMARGVPVITISNVPMAAHASAAAAGVVLDAPFEQGAFNARLAAALEDRDRLVTWGAAGRRYMETFPDGAAALLELIKDRIDRAGKNEMTVHAVAQ